MRILAVVALAGLAAATELQPVARHGAIERRAGEATVDRYTSCRNPTVSPHYVPTAWRTGPITPDVLRDCGHLVNEFALGKHTLPGINAIKITSQTPAFISGRCALTVSAKDGETAWLGQDDAIRLILYAINPDNMKPKAGVVWRGADLGIRCRSVIRNEKGKHLNAHVWFP